MLTLPQLIEKNLVVLLNYTHTNTVNVTSPVTIDCPTLTRHRSTRPKLGYTSRAIGGEEVWCGD